jgi:hypothetical protein
MALIKAGNDLTAKFVQPGGAFTNDGYGMMTARATYLVDKTVGGTAVTTGQVHPVYSDFFCHKFTLTRGALDVDTIDAEYVGILLAVGENTAPNVTASHGLTSEHITTHPNFFGPTAPFTTAIAGNGTTFSTSTINLEERVGGIFGATFKGTATNAGGFLGFKDSSTAAKQYYYGKTHYLSPITSFSGVIYTKNLANVAIIRDAVGKTSSANTFGGIKLLPDHLGTTWTASVKGTTRNTILLSQASFEDYCVPVGAAPKIVKINYEIRFNREGYPAEVYAAS